jgi:protein TonB
VPPKKIRDVAPIYPAHLRGTGVDGQVVMIAKLGVDGSVADVRVMGNPNPDLATSAIEAVQQWRFTPTLLNCTPVEPEMTVTTTFKPMPPAPPPPPQP